MSLTAAVLGVKVFVDGVQRILLFTALFPGSQDVPYTLVEEGILALQHTHMQGNKFKSVTNNMICSYIRLQYTFSH